MIVRDSQGFTLIEALVTGILVSILGLILITIVDVVARETSDSGNLSRLQAEYCVLAAQLGSAVRNGKFVLAEGETPAVSHSFPDTVDKICVFTASGKDTVSYRISGGFLQDSTAAGWRKMIIGIDTIKVAGTGAFILAGGRKTVQMNLPIRAVYTNVNDTLAISGEFFQCRN